MKPKLDPIDSALRGLLGKDVELGDRLDCAMDLQFCDRPEAEEALVRVSCDLSEDEVLAEECGQCLLCFWMRRRRVNVDLLRSIPAERRRRLLGFAGIKEDDFEKILDGGGSIPMDWTHEC